MNNRIPCITDSDEHRYSALDAIAAAHAQRVEDYADSLMSECVKIDGAKRLERAYDLYDGDLLASMMNEIACWTGSPESAAVQIRKLHNLLANELSKVAELEVKA